MSNKKEEELNKEKNEDKESSTPPIYPASDEYENDELEGLRKEYLEEIQSRTDDKNEKIEVKRQKYLEKLEKEIESVEKVIEKLSINPIERAKQLEQLQKRSG